MALAPIYCDICEHRIGPSEPISEINGKIVGLCHAQTAKTVQQDNLCLYINTSDISDYAVFKQNAFTSVPLDDFYNCNKHPYAINAGINANKKYVSCLFKSIPNSLWHNLIWVVFEANDNWDIFVKGPKWTYIYTCNTCYLIQRNSRQFSLKELDNYIKQELV